MNEYELLWMAYGARYCICCSLKQTLQIYLQHQEYFNMGTLFSFPNDNSVYPFLNPFNLVSLSAAQKDSQCSMAHCVLCIQRGRGVYSLNHRLNVTTTSYNVVHGLAHQSWRDCTRKPQKMALIKIWNTACGDNRLQK